MVLVPIKQPHTATCSFWEPDICEMQMKNKKATIPQKIKSASVKPWETTGRTLHSQSHIVLLQCSYIGIACSLALTYNDVEECKNTDLQ